MCSLALLFAGLGSLCAQVDNYSLKLTAEGSVNFRTMPELNNLSSYTVQFWINPSTWNKGAVIYSRGTNFKSYLGDANTLEFVVGDKTIKATSQELAANKWCQVSFFCDKGFGKILVNGDVVYEGTISEIPASEDNFIIGGGGFIGRIDEFRIWNDLLAMDYGYFRCNTLNKWVPQWESLVAYYKFDQNLCENVVDYKFKHHGIFSDTGAERDIVTDNEDFKYYINTAYTDFSRFFDRAIDKEKYLLSNDLLILGIESYSDGTLKLPYPYNHGNIENGSYLSEYKGRSGVLSLNGNGVGMNVGKNAFTPSDKYTFETWIYLEEWTEGAYIFKKENTEGTQGFSIRLGNADSKQVIVRVNGHEYINQKRLNVGQWVHLGVATYATDLTIEETFVFYYNGKSYFGGKGLCGTEKGSWIPQGISNFSAIVGENLKAKLDDTVIWHITRGNSEVTSDMSGLPMPGFDTTVTAATLQNANSYWNYDNPDDLGYDSYSYKHFIGIMRGAYDGYRGYKVRMSVKGHDGWEGTFADANKRKIFAQNLSEIAQEFDGVDLDFEWCYSQSCWDNYGELLLEIDKVLGKDKILTVSPHRVSYNLRPKYMDRVDYFTFQIYGPQGENFTWNTFKNAYNSFVQQGYPLNKISLSYATTTSKGYKNGSVVAASAPIGVRNGLLDGSYTPDMDIVNDGSYDRYITGFNQSYERSKFVCENKLAGIFYWDMGNDVKTNHKYSLVKASSFRLNSNVDTLVTKVVLNPSAVIPLKNEKTNRMTVYPNPATDLVSFALQSDITPFRVQVFNMSGLCVINKEGTDKKLRIKEIPNGMYSVSLLTTSGKMLSGMFIKK